MADPAREPPLFADLRSRAAAAPIVVAHRGDSLHFPENTLPAFAAGIDAGAAMVELDFHETADGELVVIHDETLDRTTDAARRFGRAEVAVAAISWREIEGLDAGTWKGTAHAGARVPRLTSALDLIAPRAVAMIEQKGGSAERVVDLLRRQGLVDRVLVQSFDWYWVAEVHRLEPRVPVGVLGEGRLAEQHFAALPRTGARLVHWNVRDLRAADVERLHALGCLVCVYTADDDVSLLGAGPMGLDAVTTNDPAHMADLVARGLVTRAAGAGRRG
jgi:glycerophosphoryl diester phosphodiesterase